MARKAGGKLRPGFREKQLSAPESRKVYQMLLSLARKGVVASQASFKRASRWLEYLMSGSTVDYRTPFYSTRGKDGHIAYRPQTEIVTMFDSVYKSVNYGPYPVLGEYLDEIESGEREKIGPMSTFLPWGKDGPTKVAAVFRDKPRLPGFDQAAWARALERLQALIKTQSCELISPETAINGLGDGSDDGMDTTTNSGSPFFRRNWKPSSADKIGRSKGGDDDPMAVYQWYLQEAKRWSAYLRRPVPTDSLPYWWAMASQRLVQKGPKPFAPKSKRIVEAYPKTEAILGKMATTGIMSALRRVTMPSGNYLMCAWNNLPVVDANMQLLLDRANHMDYVINSGDVSNFDATVPPWVLWDVGQIVATWVRGGTTLVKNLIYSMVYRTLLITPSGVYGPGPSSMKSGSAWTSLMGSMANVAIQFYGEEHGSYKIDSLAALGDDFVIGGPGVTPESTSDTFTAFGMEAHPDKQFYRPNALHFLQKLHYRGLPGGIASVYRTLGSCLSLERLSVKPEEWNKFAYDIQALSKLNNACMHPGFTNLVDFVQKGDALHLGRDMTPMELVTRSGTAGTSVLEEDAHKPWKQLGKDQSFANWAVNGVLRGESLPPLGLQRFKRVYGINPSITPSE